MISIYCLREKFGLKNIYKKIKFDRNFTKSHPDYFYSDGLVIFCGPQGSGKTLSAVNYVYNLLKLYPKSILVSNIALTDFPFDNKKVFYFENADDLQKYSNGEKGVIYLIDEIQLYFNSLESKNINMDVMTQISQQRKQRKHIVATSQVFGRMAKPLREQFSNIIVCKSYFDLLQKNQLIDRDSLDTFSSASTDLKAKVKKNIFFFRSPEMFKKYDTYCIIENKSLKVSVDSNNDLYDTSSINFNTEKLKLKKVRFS